MGFGAYWDKPYIHRPSGEKDSTMASLGGAHDPCSDVLGVTPLHVLARQDASDKDIPRRGMLGLGGFRAFGT